MTGNFWWRPGWWAGKKDLIKSLARNKDLNPCSKLLDVGCGVGRNMEILEGYGEYYGMDIATRESWPEISKKMFVGDAKNLPLKSETFDAIFFLDVLEHLDDDKKAVEEAVRVLKRNGFIMAVVPAFKFLWSRQDIIVQHKRRYNKKQVIFLLDSNELSIETISYWNFFLFFPIALMKYFTREKSMKKKENGKNSFGILGRIMNSVLFFVLKIENRLIGYSFKLPFGISIVFVARKKMLTA